MTGSFEFGKGKYEPIGSPDGTYHFPEVKIDKIRITPEGTYTVIFSDPTAYMKTPPPSARTAEELARDLAYREAVSRIHRLQMRWHIVQATFGLVAMAVSLLSLWLWWTGR